MSGDADAVRLEARIRKELRTKYIADVGRGVAETLESTGSALVGYEPGNMTHYDLSLVRCGETEIGNTFPVGETGDGRPDWVVVSWLDRGCYPFKVLDSMHGEWDPGYISGKLGGGFADGVALAMLFEAIERGSS